MRRGLLLVRALGLAVGLLAVATAGGACGRGSTGADDGGTVTGRVMSVTPTRVCVSPDRGETRRCLAPAADATAPEVGQCVTATLASKRIEVVGDAACAAGDLGDG